MKLIIGLGNPGKKYFRTRHNIGFRVVDALAKNMDMSFQNAGKFNSEIAITEDLIIAKPQTFMNTSGESVAALKNFYKLENADICVVHDEIDLPLGTIRASANSGSAGHNGIESAIQHIGRDFMRLRIGIENRKENRVPPTENYVLQPFSPEEEKKLEDIIPQAVTEIKKFLQIK